MLSYEEGQTFFDQVLSVYVIMVELVRKMDHLSPQKDSETEVFLVIYEGETWREVFRLTPGEDATIGRVRSNRIVLHDSKCSRNHCKVFLHDAEWIVRDLGSSNGTLLSGEKVRDDTPLEDGDLLQIGSCKFSFTSDLSRPFRNFRAIEEFPDEDAEDVTTGATDEIPAMLVESEEPEILTRASKSRYFDLEAGETGTRQEMVKLYKLALDMVSTGDVAGLSDIVLDGLFSSTPGDIGAVLLFPEPVGSDDYDPDSLRLVSFRAPKGSGYNKVSAYLSTLALSEREAILALDLGADARLARSQSLGELQPTGVICAPIRTDTKLHGLIHLYSLSPENILDENSLEFTLAVSDQMAIALDNLAEKETLADRLAQARDENITLRHQLSIESDLIGDSDKLQRLRNTIARVAANDATVLIRGESGVGKELVSRVVHFNSERRQGPFICMNCAALSENLLESELFGHEKGAFTGATNRKFGKFEQAHQGTLFLDEAGEMSMAIQAKFLRVLEGHSFERVGGGEQISVDVRVVAATNRDLEQAVQEGKFRKDLYFRIHVLEIDIPPLREHKTDIPALANYFMERSSRKTGADFQGISSDAMTALMAYDWPGNIGELQNTIERAVYLGNGKRITAGDIHLSRLGSSEPMNSTPEYEEMSLENWEEVHIKATMEFTQWNKRQAARILEIERSTLDRKLKRCDIWGDGEDPVE